MFLKRISDIGAKLVVIAILLSFTKLVVLAKYAIYLGLLLIAAAWICSEDT